jgi:anti-sigma factor (TIGR02949 family)
MMMATESFSACDDAMRRLWEYLDEELPEAETEDVGRHLAKCPRCGRRAAFEQRLLERITAVAPEYGELAALRERIAGVLRRRDQPIRLERCRFRHWC